MFYVKHLVFLQFVECHKPIPNSGILAYTEGVELQSPGMQIGPVGFITSTRGTGTVDVDFSVTISADGRSVSVAPLGGTWITGETVTVDMNTVDDVAGNQGSDNDTGDADNTHTFTIP